MNSTEQAYLQMAGIMGIVLIIINIIMYIIAFTLIGFSIKLFNKKRMLAILLFILAFPFCISGYELGLHNLYFQGLCLQNNEKYEAAIKTFKLGGFFAKNPNLKSCFYGEVAGTYGFIDKQGRNAVLYYDKAFSYAKTYRALKFKEVWPKRIYIFFYGGDLYSLSTEWQLLASLMYYYDNQFDKAEKIWSTTGENTEWAGFSTSIIKKDYKNALINANKMVEAKYTPNSLAQRANLHKEMGNFTAYNDDKKEAEKLCNNDTKCLDNVRKLSENYIKEQFEVYHYNRKRLGFE